MAWPAETLLLKEAVVKFTLLIRIVVPVVAFLTMLGMVVGSTTPIYASNPAAVTPTGEPATRTPPPGPSNTPETRPTLTPQPQPSNTPESRPTFEPSPEPTNPSIPEPTNTRPRDVEGERKGVSIWIRKELLTPNPQIGQELEFRLVINNNGDLTAQDVVVTDPLPSFLQLVNVSTTRGTINTDGNTVTVEVGPVGAGDTVYITIVALLLENPPEGAVNSATVRTSSNDEESDNHSTVRIPRDGGAVEGQVTRTPVIELTQTAAAIIPEATLEVTPELTEEAVLEPVAPTATPAIPARLPTTSDDGSGTLIIVFAALACMSLVLGLALRRQGRPRA
jgi:uncharacterized repeat protein (TIGR01451 family)